MSIENRTVARLRLREEPAGSYELDMTSAGTSFTSFVDVPFISGSLQVSPMVKMLPTDHVQQFIDGYSEEIPGPKSWKLSFKMHLAPTGVAANASTTSVESVLATLQKICMGGISLSAGTDMASGVSTAGCTVTTGHGSRVPVGTAVGIGVQTTPQSFEVAEVKSQSTDAITWKRVTATTPVTGAVYRSSTIYLKEDPDTSMQFALDFVETDERLILMGGQGSFTVEIGNGELPTATFSIEGTDWLQYAGSAISVATFTNLAPVAVYGSEFQVCAVGSTSRGVLPISALAINPNLAYENVPYPGRQNVYRKRRVRSAPSVSGSFTVPYEAATWLTARANKSDHAIFAQIGSAAGNAMLISVPTIQILDVQPVEVGKLSYQQVSWKARHDAEIGGGATEITRSALRFHYV